MKLIIAGGRDTVPTDEHRRVVMVLLDEVEEVVSGGASGVDQWGERLAHELDIPVRVFHANWRQHGKAAGPIRNREMVGYADAVALLPGGRGTESMSQEARRAGIWVFDLRADRRQGDG